MSILRLGLCVLGVYSMYLLWAVAQERMSVPFKTRDGLGEDKFKSPVFLGTCQSAASALAALVYLLARAKSGQTWHQLLGLAPPPTSTKSAPSGNPVGKINGHATNGHTVVNGHKPSNGLDSNHSSTTRSLIIRYAQCAVFIATAAPFGFASLSYVSYPTLVLSKSCKLVPVMLMNVLLYRRRFARHKYVVVALVTAGITMFMALGKEGSSGKHGASAGSGPSLRGNLIGGALLLINLALDGATNSTQDEVFARHPHVSGQQMMLWINALGTALTLALSILPLGYIPVFRPDPAAGSEIATALAFIREHPSVVRPLAAFALTGALGQIFIFETLQHFGSLTLTTITLTRKLFTMILSVVVYNHKLTGGQWLGAAVVFAGICVEAWVKRRDVHAKRVLREQEKAKIKDL